jgi:hypothetical protein
MSQLFWQMKNGPGGEANITQMGDIMKQGYSLQTDQITAKYNSTQAFYPQPVGYTDANKFNPIGSYSTYLVYGSESSWEGLKYNLSTYGNAIIYISIYSNTLTGLNGTLFNEPTGTPVDSHYVTAIGYNNTKDEVYFLQSWGPSRFGYSWTKIEGISHNYWTFPAGTRSNFIVPKTMTINEVLAPQGITGLANGTPYPNNITWSWVNPLHTDFNHTYTLKNNVFYRNYSNSTTSDIWSGLTGDTGYTISTKTVDLSGHMNSTWINSSSTTTHDGSITPSNLIQIIMNYIGTMIGRTAVYFGGIK